MRMAIRAGSLWLAYTLTKPQAIQDLLPPKLVLARSPLLEDEAAIVKTPKLLFNAYDVASPWMRGMRVDVVALTRHVDTDVMHLVVLDCFTNALRWDPVSGVRRANAYVKQCQPDRADEFKLLMRSRQEAFDVVGHLGAVRDIDWKFSVEANRVWYFGDCPTPFAMEFNETLVAQPVRQLHTSDISNTLWRSVRSDKPSHAFVHPHAMMFDVDVDSFSI